MAEEKEYELGEDDWEVLLKHKIVRVGRKDIPVYPLGIDRLNLLIRKLVSIAPEMESRGITAENFATRMLDVAEVVLTNCPSVISLLVNLKESDAKKLPASIVLQILNDALEVNIESQADLIKNLGALADKINRLLSKEVTEMSIPETNSVTPSNS